MNRRRSLIHSRRQDAAVEALRERHRGVLEGGGEKLQRRHRERGKIPVRERIVASR
jgi:acetyl-CoA carboxylase carboxyltransferase component